MYNADLELGWVNRKQCTKDLEKGDVSELRQWFVEKFGGYKSGLAEKSDLVLLGS